METAFLFLNVGIFSLQHWLYLLTADRFLQCFKEIRTVNVNSKGLHGAFL